MSKIFFEDGRIVASIIHGSLSFTLAIKKTNVKSLAFIKRWVKKRSSKDVVLWQNKKPWIFFKCRIITNSEEKGAFFTSRKRYFSVSIDYEKGDIVTKHSEYRKIPWIKKARKFLIEEYKEKRKI